MLLNGPTHTLTDFQAEYAGLLMGDGTPYGLPPGLDWLDLPPLKTMDQARDWADGSWSGPDFTDVRTITATLEISPTVGTTFRAACTAFLTAITAGSHDLPFWMKLPGFPVLGIGAKVAKRSLPIDIGFELGTLATAAVQWRAVNPQWQSLPRSTTLIPVGAAPSGMRFPLFTVGGIISFGATGTSASTAVLQNAGNAPAWPLITMQGPCSGFTVTLDGNPVTYGAAIATGQSVTLDYATGRATLVATGATPGVDRTYNLTSRRFSPVIATSTIALAADGGSATVTIADLWR